MTIVVITETTNGLFERDMVQYTDKFYTRLGVPAPLHRAVWMITGMIRLSGGYERIEIMNSLREKVVYDWANPKDMERI